MCLRNWQTGFIVPRNVVVFVNVYQWVRVDDKSAAFSSLHNDIDNPSV